MPKNVPHQFQWGFFFFNGHACTLTTCRSISAERKKTLTRIRGTAAAHKCIQKHSNEALEYTNATWINAIHVLCSRKGIILCRAFRMRFSSIILILLWNIELQLRSISVSCRRCDVYWPGQLMLISFWSRLQFRDMFSITCMSAILFANGANIYP